MPGTSGRRCLRSTINAIYLSFIMKIIIVGAYAIGTHLARLLSRNNHDTILIDSDENRLSNIGSDYDLMTIQASVSRIKTLTDAGVSSADLFIAVTPDENLNMNACMLAKSLGAKRTVAKIDNSEYINPRFKLSPAGHRRTGSRVRTPRQGCRCAVWQSWRVARSVLRTSSSVQTTSGRGWTAWESPR